MLKVKSLIILLTTLALVGCAEETTTPKPQELPAPPQQLNPNPKETDTADDYEEIGEDPSEIKEIMRQRQAEQKREDYFDLVEYLHRLRQDGGLNYSFELGVLSTAKDIQDRKISYRDFRRIHTYLYYLRSQDRRRRLFDTAESIDRAIQLTELGITKEMFHETFKIFYQMEDVTKKNGKPEWMYYGFLAANKAEQYLTKGMSAEKLEENLKFIRSLRYIDHSKDPENLEHSGRFGRRLGRFGYSGAYSTDPNSRRAAERLYYGHKAIGVAEAMLIKKVDVQRVSSTYNFFKKLRAQDRRTILFDGRDAFEISLNLALENAFDLDTFITRVDEIASEKINPGMGYQGLNRGTGLYGLNGGVNPYNQARQLSRLRNPNVLRNRMLFQDDGRNSRYYGKEAIQKALDEMGIYVDVYNVQMPRILDI